MQFQAHDFGLDHFASRPFNCEALSSAISLRAEGQKVSKAVSIVFITRNIDDKDISTQMGIINVGNPPPPSVYLMSLHMTKSPRPSPSVFTYCKRSNTGKREQPGNEAIPVAACIQ